MRTLATLRLAFRNIQRHLLRSTITSIGIVVGVAAVVSIASIGSGAKARVETILSRLDRNQLQVGAERHRNINGPYSYRKLERGEGLTFGDYRALASEIRAVSHISILMVGSETHATSRHASSAVQVVGVDESGVELLARR